jgi:glutamine cyclotransferase
MTVTALKPVKNRASFQHNSKLLKYKIINTYPHDTKSFTEGLEFYKDTLYESTGSVQLRGAYKSYLRKYDYKTGKVYKQIDLEDKYFGEGITLSMVNYIS